MAQNKLELLLTAKDSSMSATVKRNIALFKSFKKEADSLFKSLNKLTGTKKLSFSGSGINKLNTDALKLKKTLESLGKVNVPTNLNSGNRSNPQTELDRLYNRNPRNKPNRLADFHDNYIDPMRQIGDMFRREFDSLTKYTDETKKLYRAQEKFKLLNLSNNETQKGFDAVKKTVQDIRGANLTNTTEDLTDLFGALGNVNSAIESLPLAAKYRTNFSAIFGDELSDKDISKQIQNAFKFLELTGATNKGRAQMEQSLDSIVKIANSTGGRVTSADLLQMARRGGASVTGLTPQGLRNISSIIEELGGDSTGTSLMTMYQTLVAGKMKQSSAQRFDYFGLLDKSKIEYGNAQKIKKIAPGANILGDMMMEDPLRAADRLAQAFKEKGIDTKNTNAVNRELSLLFGDRKGFQMMSMLINQRDQIVKESERANQSKGILGMDEQLANSELKKLQEFESAVKNFKTEIGKPLMEAGSGIAKSLIPMMEFFGNHPNITKWTIYALGAVKVLKMLSETASILNSSSLTSFFTKNADAVGGASTKVAGFTRNIDAAANKTSAFQRMASSPITITLVATGAILAVETLLQHWQELDERITKTSENAKSVRETYDNLMGRNLLYNKPGDYQGKQGEFDELAKQFFTTIREGRTLETNLHPERANWWEHYKNLTELPYGTSDQTAGGQFNPTVAANKWSAQIGIVSRDVNVLARVLSQLQNGQIYNDEGKQIPLNFDDIKLLTSTIEKVAGKEKMDKARDILKKGEIKDVPNKGLYDLPIAPKTNELNQAFFNLTQPASGLATNFSNLLQPSTSLTGQFTGLNSNSMSATTAVGTFATSTSNAAARIDSVQFKAPAFITNNSTSTNPFSNPFGRTNFLGGGRARGGSVTKGKTYPVGESGMELFTAGQSGSIISNDILRNSRGGSAAIQPNVTLSVSINVDGAENPKAVAIEIKQELASLVSQLKEQLDPRNVAKSVAFEAERDYERT